MSENALLILQNIRRKQKHGIVFVLSPVFRVPISLMRFNSSSGDGIGVWRGRRSLLFFLRTTARFCHFSRRRTDYLGVHVSSSHRFRAVRKSPNDHRNLYLHGHDPKIFSGANLCGKCHSVMRNWVYYSFFVPIPVRSTSPLENRSARDR